MIEGSKRPILCALANRAKKENKASSDADVYNPLSNWICEAEMNFYPKRGYLRTLVLSVFAVVLVVVVLVSISAAAHRVGDFTSR